MDSGPPQSSGTSGDNVPANSDATLVQQADQENRPPLRGRETSVVAFPSYDVDPPVETTTPPTTADTQNTPPSGRRRSMTASGRIRSASQKIMDYNPPLGMWGASGEVLGRAPSLLEIRKGNFSHEGWDEEAQRRSREGTRASQTSTASGRTGLSSRRGSAVTPGSSRRGSSGAARRDELSSGYLGPPREPIPRVSEEVEHRDHTAPIDDAPTTTTEADTGGAPEIDAHDKKHHKKEKPVKVYANGYIPPPKHTWTESTVIGLKAFWKFFITPFGFVITVYGLNVVAWGAMIFFLLIGAAPAMCHPSCNDINSARRKWIEWDSQILTALFCVTGFGLIPWRFRDMYYLMQYRLLGKESGLRRLAGINRSWFRLQGSDSPSGRLPQSRSSDREAPVPDLPDDPSLPIPTHKAPELPPTDEYAAPTPTWKLDFYIWMYMWNTIFQAVLCGLMWGMNRYNRPSWGTGLFVSLGCIVAGAGGILTFVEGRRVKQIEGVQPTAEMLKIRDEENGSSQGPDDDRGPSNEKAPADIQEK